MCVFSVDALIVKQRLQNNLVLQHIGCVLQRVFSNTTSLSVLHVPLQKGNCVSYFVGSSQSENHRKRL